MVPHSRGTVPHSRGATLFSILLIWPLFAGCHNLANFSSLGITEQAEVDPATTAVCTVEFRAGNRPGNKVQVPLTPNMRIQDALVESKAVRKYRDMQIEIYRVEPQQPGGRVKLTCQYDRQEQRVSWETDYALMPNDHIIVREKMGGLVDEMVGSLVGPIFGQL